MGPDEATVIAVGDDGNLCIAGRLRSELDFDDHELRRKAATISRTSGADAPRPSSDEMIDFLQSSGSTPVKLFLYERTTENQWVQTNWVSLITREDGDSVCSGIGQERRCAKVQLGELFAFDRTCANFADGKQYALSLADEPRIVVDPLDADYD
jgi:hypothetical protein